MKKLFLGIALISALGLMGAGCGQKPVEPVQPFPTEPQTITKPESSAQSDQMDSNSVMVNGENIELNLQIPEDTTPRIYKR